MKRPTRSLVPGLLIFTALCATSPLSAQDRPMTPAELHALAADHTDEEATDRSVVAAFLARPAVQRLAATAGIDIQAVQDAARLLTGGDLAAVASRIRDVEDQEAMVGGDTLVISSTAIIIALLVIILVIVA